jgi:hypothetical protein
MPTLAASTLLLLLGGAASKEFTVETEALGILGKKLGNALGMAIGDALVEGRTEEGQGGGCRANQEILNVQEQLHDQLMLLQKDFEMEPWSEDRDGILEALQLLDTKNQEEAQSVAGEDRCREMSRDLQLSANLLSSPAKAMEFRDGFAMMLRSSAKKLQGADYQLSSGRGQAIAEPFYKLLAGSTDNDVGVGEDYFFLEGLMGLLGGLPALIMGALGLISAGAGAVSSVVDADME